MSSDHEDPLNIVTQGAVDGIGNFLAKICMPAAEEFGYLLRDKVKHWRTINFINVVRKTQLYLEKKPEKIEPTIDPRLLNLIYENSSWIEDDDLQTMWAGLFASSCSDKKSDTNIIYIDILSKISKAEAWLLNHFCQNCEFEESFAENMVLPKPVFIGSAELKEITKSDVFEDVAQYLLHLEFLGVIKQQIYSSGEYVESYDSIESDPKDWEQVSNEFLNMLEVSVTNLGYRLYLKCIGVSSRPSEYVGKKSPSRRDDDDDYIDLDGVLV